MFSAVNFNAGESIRYSLAFGNPSICFIGLKVFILESLDLNIENIYND